AHTLRHARHDLLLAVDRLRTLLLNADDLTATVSTLAGQVQTIAELARTYRYARHWIDLLVDDPARVAYAEANPGRSPRRHYVDPGDSVLVVLPHTDSCRRHGIAGQATRIRVDDTDVELTGVDGDRLRLAHADAGIHHDQTDGGLYILQSAAVEATAVGS
ncbi:hypothetical protein, partial [Micromonospora echinofusca]